MTKCRGDVVLVWFEPSKKEATSERGGCVSRARQQRQVTVVQQKLESAGVRFGVYVEDLREFFRSRQVPFGSPGNLVAFAAKVEKPGPLQDEMGSMVRSILFQENEALGHGEMMELLTIAVGGPAVDTGAPDVQVAVRQILLFVNEALRQNRTFSTESPMANDDEQVTAGDVLAAAATSQDKTGGRTVLGRSPENGHFGRGADPLDRASAPVEGRGALRGEPLGGGMLFRAVSMSDADEADAGFREWNGQSRRWLVPAIVAGVIALVVAGYLARPLLDRSGASRAAQPGIAQVGPVIIPGSCVASPAGGSLRSSLSQRSLWAHRLLDGKMYAAALPELKAIAQADPGFPGVYLDESDALLHLKRPEDARDAVDTQMGISECMANLPTPAMDKYCTAEFSVAAAATCRPELARIREAAQLQAAMVHLELGHRFAPESAAASADLSKEDISLPTRPHAGQVFAPAVRPRSVAPLPPASEDDNARPIQLAVAKSKTATSPKNIRKVQNEDPLKNGEGTDSSFGAYSKPQ